MTHFKLSKDMPKAKAPKPPKLVRNDGHLTDAGVAVVTYLDETYLANKLPVSQSTRVYVAHRHVMGLSAEKTLRDNQSIHAGLCEVFTRLAMREIAELKAKFAESQTGGE